MNSNLKSIYKKYISFPWLDLRLSHSLDTLTNWYSALQRYSFPANYIRRWKLDMLFGHYEEETSLLFKNKLRSGMQVVDIGAHIGYFTRIFSKLVGPHGKVYAFEADPENFALLKKNTRHLKNVVCYQTAISDRAGTIDFYHYDDKAGCHSILPDAPIEYAKRKITVPAITLDAFVKENGVTRVDFIKMDIEGGETAALRGMQNTLRKPDVSLVFEFAPEWVRKAGNEPLAMLRQLESQGFKLFVIGTSLAPLSTTSDVAYLSHLPQTPSHYNEFINIYCVKH